MGVTRQWRFVVVDRKHGIETLVFGGRCFERDATEDHPSLKIKWAQPKTSAKFVHAKRFDKAGKDPNISGSVVGPRCPLFMSGLNNLFNNKFNLLER
jgi:hypothetical protein